MQQLTEKENAQAEIPSGNICSITSLIMLDPVVDDCGHSFERDAIEQWLTDPRATCPLSKQPIKKLTPNFSLKTNIEEFLVKHPELKNQQYKKDSLVDDIIKAIAKNDGVKVAELICGNFEEKLSNLDIDHVNLFFKEAQNKIIEKEDIMVCLLEVFRDKAKPFLKSAGSNGRTVFWNTAHNGSIKVLTNMIIVLGDDSKKMLIEKPSENIPSALTFVLLHGNEALIENVFNILGDDLKIELQKTALTTPAKKNFCEVLALNRTYPDAIISLATRWPDLIAQLYREKIKESFGNTSMSMVPQLTNNTSANTINLRSMPPQNSTSNSNVRTSTNSAMPTAMLNRMFQDQVRNLMQQRNIHTGQTRITNPNTQPTYQQISNSLQPNTTSMPLNSTQPSNDDPVNLQDLTDLSQDQISLISSYQQAMPQMNTLLAPSSNNNTMPILRSQNPQINTVPPQNIYLAPHQCPLHQHNSTQSENRQSNQSSSSQSSHQYGSQQRQSNSNQSSSNQRSSSHSNSSGHRRERDDHDHEHGHHNKYQRR